MYVILLHLRLFLNSGSSCIISAKNRELAALERVDVETGQQQCHKIVKATYAREEQK